MTYGRSAILGLSLLDQADGNREGFTGRRDHFADSAFKPVRSLVGTQKDKDD